MDTALEVLKWVIIVLLAGFIGQFGKTMSRHVMDYFRKRREKRISTVSSGINGVKRTHTEPQEISAAKKEVILSSKEKEEKGRSKAEKKALKNQLKAKKKSEKAKGKG